MEATTINDPVLRLAHYWLAAKLMHEHVHDMKDHFGSIMAIDDAGEAIEFEIYLGFWLSALYVVAEGFKELRLSDEVIEPLIADHLDSLRLYRNATFHFQRKPDKHIQFHDGQANRLNWAEDLHEAFLGFFEDHLRSLGALPEENV